MRLTWGSAHWKSRYSAAETTLVGCFSMGRSNTISANRTSTLIPTAMRFWRRSILNASQVVFSVADLKTQIQAGDEVWLPRFATAEGKLRFLGPPDQKPSNDPIVIT